MKEGGVMKTRKLIEMYDREFSSSAQVIGIIMIVFLSVVTVFCQAKKDEATDRNATPVKAEIENAFSA